MTISLHEIKGKMTKLPIILITFINNISVILWQPVLLLEENEAPNETC
jgi:hypothetical protein